MEAFRALRLAVFVWALPLIPSPLSAQTEGDPDLYIPPVLTVSASAHSAAAMGMLYGLPTGSVPLEDAVAIRRKRSVTTDPLLPIIFFDPGSSTIPTRYTTFLRRSDADAYEETSEVRAASALSDESGLEKYYQLLDIVGSRMRRYPGTTISLEGGYSIEPGETAEIARERAAVVKEYLETIWAIAPERIAIAPPRRACDSSAHPFHQEEARRVIIESESWLIHRPVRYYVAALEEALILVLLVVEPKESPEHVAGMSVTITSGDDVLGVTALPASPDSSIYRHYCYWSLPRDVDALDEGVTFRATLTMTDGSRRISAPVTLPVRLVSESAEDAERSAEIFRHLSRRFMDGLEEEERDILTAEIIEEDTHDGEVIAEEGVRYYTDRENENVQMMAVEIEEDAYDGDIPELREGVFDEESETPPVQPSEEERLALLLAKEEKLTTIGFFTAGDTALRRHQRLMAEQCLATAFAGHDAGRTGTPTILLEVNGEEGDNPLADHARIAVDVANARSARDRAAFLRADPTFQASLVPVAEVGSILNVTEDTDEWATRFSQRMFGDRAAEIANWEEGVYNDTTPYTGSEKKAVDSVLTARGEIVARHIRSVLPAERYDTIRVVPSPGFPTDLPFQENRLPALYLPEGRYYKRSVMLSLSFEPYDEWDGEEGETPSFDRPE